MLARLLCLMCFPCVVSAADITPAQAAALYHRNCSVCHGDNGNGQSRARGSFAAPPRDFTAREARAELPRDYMMAIVRDGKHGTAMAGRRTRLSEAQIEAVVDFVRTAFMPPQPGTPLARGYAIYQQRCVACHGDRGQGGVAGHARVAVPAISRTRPGGQMSREAMIDAVSGEKHARGTARGGDKLSRADIEAVVDYVRTVFIDGVATSPRAGN